MTVHRLINTTLGIGCLVALIAFMQHLDAADAAFIESKSASDARQAAVKARRDELARVEFCIRSQGPQSLPVEQEDGSFRCLGKRGQKGPFVVAQQ